MPIFRKATEERIAVSGQLRTELGREPTREEVVDRLVEIHGWDRSALRPYPGGR